MKSFNAMTAAMLTLLGALLLSEFKLNYNQGKLEGQLVALDTKVNYLVVEVAKSKGLLNGDSGNSGPGTGSVGSYWYIAEDPGVCEPAAPDATSVAVR